MGASYRQAGVDIDAGSRAVAAIREHVRSTRGPQVLSDVGGFGGLFAFQGSHESVLVASTDSVGTKVMIAFTLDRHDTIGSDLVNHCVNDILVCGARPLFFLDYIGIGQLEPGQVERIVAGIADACRANGCALLGGEMAELPGLYKVGEYDVAGFIVGTVERGQLIDGSRVEAGDVLLGLPSSGLHTNGYSLVRQVLGLTGEVASDRRRLERYEPALGRNWGEELLVVHRAYLPTVMPLLAEGLVKGMAHITGGGLIDNVPRALPASLAARFKQGSWTVPPVFSLLQDLGGISADEMYRVFNMGLGLVLTCAPDAAASIQRLVPEAVVVGEIVAGVKDAPRVTIEE